MLWYTALLLKLICIIFVPPDSQHNMLTINPGHNNRISGDPRTPTTCAPVLDLQTHKVWGLGKTPIKLPALEKYLSDYPKTQTAKKLFLGFSQGFQLYYTGPRIHIQSKNLISAYEHHNELREKIMKEVELGRVGGPFRDLPISNLRISPIGVVPKGDNSGWRLITHLSFPKFNSVNFFIDPEESSVKYTSFDSVIQMIAKIGQGAFIAKCDIKSAFRLLPICPGDFDLLGFMFDDMYYIDKCLPMGCSVSCKVFQVNRHRICNILKFVGNQKILCAHKLPLFGRFYTCRTLCFCL